MPDRSRYYLTTAIAYPNNKPGLHTLYEVIGADAIARWHRMKGDDTRFLTGTDEHSVNIAQRAAELGKDTKAFVDEMVGLFTSAEDALLISPDRFIRTTDADHRRASQEMVRRAYANGDVYLGSYEGWYCPNEGFKAPSDLEDGPDGQPICPNHPNIELQWLTERNWFFRLSAYRDRLLEYFEAHPDWVEPEYRKNEMVAFLRQGLEDISISRETFHWGIPFPIAEDGGSAQREDGSWDPEAGVIYVWFDALINYITGAGFPDDPGEFAKWWPADLHVIGKDINRFHTIIWPAMLMSAGLELPRKVWVHGWLLARGGERMSKSRGNMLEPADVVAAFGPDGARFVTLREVAFDRDSEVSWDSFVRRYNADLANDFGNLVNRTVTMASRYLDGRRPAPQAAADSPLAIAWAATLPIVAEKLEACLLHEALAALWEFVGAANRSVEAEQPWALAKALKTAEASGDASQAAGAQARLEAVLGDLVEACRVIALAAASFMPSIAPRVLDQLGYRYPYGSDGNAGPPLLELLEWAAATPPGAAGPDRLGTPTPLFPRLEAEVVEPAAVGTSSSRAVDRAGPPSSRRSAPRRSVMAKGTITHVEFPADDPERAKRFYEAVAGWEFSEMSDFPNYYLFRTEEAHGGAVGQRGQSTGQVVRLYITVDKLEDAVAAAEQHGGKVVTPPTDIPGQGRYAAVLDSEGSEIGLWENPA